MYKILIVDDEKIERKGVSFLVKQMDVQCELVESVNGQAALEYLQDNKVDILLTDVKMPHMDGIELIKQIKDRNINPAMKIVIISGFSDFEYAKLAVKMGVSDYILKPVDPREFEPTLKKIMDEIETEKLDKVLVEQSMSFVKQHYLYALVNGLGVDDIPGIQLGAEGCGMDYDRLMLIEFDKTFFGKKDDNFGMKLKECVNKYDPDHQYLNLNTEQGVVFFAAKDKEDSFYKNVAMAIVQMIEQEYMSKAYIAISAPFTDSEQVGQIFDDTETIMENRFYQTETRVFMASEEGEASSDVQVDDDTLMKQMKQDIKMKDTTGLREHFKKLCQKYGNKKDFSQVYIKFIFSNLLKDFYDNIPDVSEIELNNEIDRLYKSSDFDTVIEIINTNIDRLDKTFTGNPQMAHREIEDVKQYIYTHYGEEIGVEQLAEMVYLAPSYLSCIFKKETGQNLSKFIKAYRMEKAKEMLENSHKKIVNISNDVGYPNVSYFCQSFREYFGVSPQKFRSQGEM